MAASHHVYISQVVTSLDFDFVEYNLDIRIDIF